MNNRQLVEIAALVSAYSPHLVEGRTGLPPGALEKFWDRSQRRLKLWLSALLTYQRQSLLVASEERGKLWTDLLPVLEEIFVSEVLTRVWTAILTAMDQERGTRNTEPIARNVMLGHLDARKRALQLLVTDSTLTHEMVLPLDAVRRRVERWTDLLLGHLVEAYRVDDFAFDPQRAREFGAQQLLQSEEQSRDQAWVLVLIGLRTAFSSAPVDPPNELIQEEIISSILACFPPGAFQLSGPFRPIIADRIPQGAVATGTTPFTGSNEISFRQLRDRFPPQQN